MKRYGNLWRGLISFPSLLCAAQKAERGKRFRSSVAAFHFQLERNLWQLHDELATKTYEPGPYRTFYVYEPKKRLISAAPYRDRVVHHAMTGVLDPIFERSFICNSFACREGKGTHAAVRQAQQLARRFRYVLKADIRKFFPSLDHEILKALVRRKIKDPDVLWLTGLIIDHSNPQEPVLDWYPGDDLFTPGQRRRGIPIGNQSSQFFANVYLDPLDHFLKDHLRVGGYVRYVDDFLVFSNDKGELNEVREAVAEFLVKLRLRLHPDKTVVFPVTEGIRFLGYRVFPTHRLLVKDNVRRFRRRARRMQRQYADREVELAAVRQRLMSWAGHARQADTFLLRERLFATITFRRATAEKPRVARRVVQQQRAEPAFGQPQQQQSGQP
ncbi:MAG: RNA-dependent DNA polymerase [Planctomycetaceae bacterium]|nr:RNA-dependent DNA polymerase [Planctomycetaceae bacterium]